MDSIRLRRWAGATVLVVALGMLVAGLTFLKGRLENAVFLLYWMLCFVLTMAAFVFAFLDMQAVRRRTRQEQRALLESALEEIAQKAREESNDHR